MYGNIIKFFTPKNMPDGNFESAAYQLMRHCCKVELLFSLNSSSHQSEDHPEI